MCRILLKILSEALAKTKQHIMSYSASAGSLELSWKCWWRSWYWKERATRSGCCTTWTRKILVDEFKGNFCKSAWRAAGFNHRILLTISSVTPWEIGLWKAQSRWCEWKVLFFWDYLILYFRCHTIARFCSIYHALKLWLKSLRSRETAMMPGTKKKRSRASRQVAVLKKIIFTAVQECGEDR